MFKKHFQTTFTLLFFILFTSVITSTALSGNVFVPKQYTRTGGAPNIYTDTFQSTGGTASLIIKNGSPAGADRVAGSVDNYTITSAKVYLNGIEIFGPDDFKNAAYYMEKSIQLNTGSNTLTVELSSSPGSYITAEITGNVILSPTIGITANPETIGVGASSVLRWTTTNAVSCSIDQGIGNVAVNGSLTVSPAQTTTYTITATGAGGTTTKAVTVTVISSPTVTISANPVSIMQGQSSTLNWSTANATTCAIDQGIGSVATSGSKTVAPAQTTTYTITASGPGGTTQAAITVRVSTVSKIDITIMSPADGASVTGSSVMVTGTVNNSFGYETGVMVNGVIAAISGTTFAANHVPLTVGTNTITVTAADATGTSATKFIVVNAALAENYISIISSLESGTAPLTVTLLIDGSFNIVNPVITPYGPGSVEQLTSANSNEFRYNMITEGVYSFTAQVTGPDNNVYQDTAVITVLSFSQLSELLKSKWEGMKSSLLAGDIDTAISYFVVGTQSKYRTKFTGLSSADINAIFSNISRIELSQVHGQIATCGAIRTEAGGTYSYPLTFIKDGNGIWKIFRF